MGGLHPEISDGIKMFKPKSLEEAICLACMQVDQQSMPNKKFHCISYQMIKELLNLLKIWTLRTRVHFQGKVLISLEDANMWGEGRWCTKGMHAWKTWRSCGHGLQQRAAFQVK